MVSGPTRILVNHLGFVPKDAKPFVIQEPPAEEFQVVRRWDGQIVFAGRLKRVSGELGDAWVGSFGDVREEGTYVIRCGEVTSQIITVYRGVYEYPLRTLFNYFPSQRCGDSPRGWHGPCHTADARRVDTGEHVDVSGGWHQSCDLRKWTFGTSAGLFGLAQLGLLHSLSWDQGQVAEELRWGNRYFHKMVRPDGGLMDHVVLPLGWSEERDVYPNDAPACAAYATIVGEALVARYFQSSDPDYSRQCLELARRMWHYVTGPGYPTTPYQPPVVPRYHEWMPDFFSQNYRGSALDVGDRLYAAIALHATTGERGFLEDACRCATSLVGLQVGGDVAKDPAAACFQVSPNRSEFACAYYDGWMGPLGLAELLELRPDHPDAGRWREAVERIAEQKCAMAERNPWGLIPSYWYTQNLGGGRPAGSGWYRYFYRHNTLMVGVNPDILGAALFLLRVQRLDGDRRYRDVASRQLDWILGCNPFNASTVEGIGRNQPERLINRDEFFPPVPQIPGAVMTGIKGTGNDEPAEPSGGVDCEYDMPPTSMLIWLMAELGV